MREWDEFASWGIPNKKPIKLICLILLLWIFLAGSIKISPQREFDIEIVEYTWTDEISEDDNCKNRWNKIAPEGSLYLWMRIRCRQKVLDYIQSNRRLPIRHKWFRLVGTKAFPEFHIRNQDLIRDLNEKRIQEFEKELLNKGYFEIKIWSKIENIRMGRWMVKVVYYDNTPFFYQEDKKGKKRELIYFIEVRPSLGEKK